MNDRVYVIAHNLDTLRRRITELAHAAGRNPGTIQLIAVSKTQPCEAVESAIKSGQQNFGENTIQDAMTKLPLFRDRPITWHFIGHLQTNKAKHIPGNFAWLHSLDSVKLATRLSHLLQEKHTTLNTLIEVNITRDPVKHGVVPEELMPLLEQLLKEALPALTLRGLMAMGPYPATEKEMRTTFATVRQLRDECADRFALPQFTELSLGMSGDYAEAIKEGSTMLRIGTAIFGERDYLE